MDWAAARTRLRGPVFAPLAPALARLDPFRWPTHADLTRLAEGIVTSRDIPLRFVPPRAQRDERRPNYERHIAESGEVETRADNWHDLFNALAWIAFPKAKAAINEQHAAMLSAGGEEEARRRNPARDALTLFDEGGVVVASSSPALLRLIVDFEWKELFWHRRAELSGKVRFIAFGHSLFEKALDPFIGIVAKTVFVPVSEMFAMLPPESQVAQADVLLAAHFANRSRFTSPKVMAPIPVFGIPGWYPDTERESYYDDKDHFRER
ncbi:MAG: DUF3025 domain-containing protein [Betaproteobacteria bacterium]|nr:DUF3025 domain-containing protein [Betaproteobacteria bacterium]